MVDEVIKCRASAVVNGLNIAMSSPTFTLEDFNLAPVYASGWYSDIGGTTPVTPVQEDAVVYLRLNCTNVKDGTIYDYAFTGDGVNDFTLNIPKTGTVTVSGGVAVLSVIVVGSNGIGISELNVTFSRYSKTVNTNKVAIQGLQFLKTATPNGRYDYYSNANGEIVLDPLGKKQLTITGAVSSGDQYPDYDAGAGGLTMFYLPNDDDTWTLPSQYTNNVDPVYQRLLANNHGNSEAHNDFPIDWAMQHSKAIFTMRGESGWERISGDLFDLEAACINWGNISAVDAAAKPDRAYIADGIKLTIKSITKVGYVYTAVLLIENTNKKTKILKTSYGRYSQLNIGFHGMFGTGGGGVTGNTSNGSITIADTTETLPAVITTPEVSTVMNSAGGTTVKSDGSLQFQFSNGLPVVYEGGILEKLEYVITGDQTAVTYWISKGRVEDWKAVTGVFDGTNTILNIPVVTKNFRMVGVCPNVIGFSNRRVFNARLRYTFTDGTVLYGPYTNNTYGSYLLATPGNGLFPFKD